MPTNLKTAAFGDKRNARQTLIDAMGSIDSAKVAVVVWVDQEDVVHTTWSDGGMLMRCGMLDCAKQYMLDDCKE